MLIDGLGVGDVGNIVLRDRRQLSEDGIIIVVVTISNGEVVAGPDIVSRGFVYVRESEQLMEKAKARVNDALAYCSRKNISEWALIKTRFEISWASICMKKQAAGLYANYYGDINDSVFHPVALGQPGCFHSGKCHSNFYCPLGTDYAGHKK